ncbi:NUDIX hydrolase [Streptomyces sp. NPDC006463]|uniref:NUDIX hydrolase n=1 Tax=Streptomyces sp. NPDC006463 TaxID=3364746 RepID=UPI003696009C
MGMGNRRISKKPAPEEGKGRMTDGGPTSFHRIKIRVAALVFDGQDVALIRRTNERGMTHYSLPGGNVEPAEPLPSALQRELEEELGLKPEDLTGPPSFTWLLDAMVTRPGSSPPRKLHMVYRVHLGPDVRPKLKAFEDDDAVGRGEIVWLPYDQTQALDVFPPVPIAALADSTEHVDAASAMLPPLNDTNYQWI